MASTSELPDILSSAVTAIQSRPSTSQQTPSNDNPITQTMHDQTIRDDHQWRNVLSFWILGLCNNYGFVVMLSAAYDIIKRFDGFSVWKEKWLFNSISNSFHCFFSYFKDQFIDPLALATDRDCIVMSTGVLLLADTIPSLIVKFVAPFLPMYIK